MEYIVFTLILGYIVISYLIFRKKRNYYTLYLRLVEELEQNAN